MVVEDKFGEHCGSLSESGLTTSTKAAYPTSIVAKSNMPTRPEPHRVCVRTKSAHMMLAMSPWYLLPSKPEALSRYCDRNNLSTRHIKISCMGYCACLDNWKLVGAVQLSNTSARNATVKPWLFAESPEVRELGDILIEHQNRQRLSTLRC